MRIKKLELKNFRGFEDLTIDFPEGESGLAVFVGVNGSGKTSVLEGVATLLQIFSNHAFGFESNIELDNDDILNNKPYSEGNLYLEDDTKIRFKVQRAEGHYPKQIDLKVHPEYTRTEAEIDEYLELHGLNIPLISYYPSTRFVPDEPSLKAKDVSKMSAYDAYEDAFNRHIDYTAFFEWFRNMEDYENEQRLYNNSTFRHNGLETVRRAISAFLDDFAHPRIRRQPKEEMVIEKKGIPLSLTNLSSGEKSIFALFGDIARRLCMACLGTNDPLQWYGIVLIDEVEWHLHPAWQRTIIPNLRRTFPNIQFILTTHSPQVLSNVPRENVFVLEDFKLVKTPHTFGRDSNSILWDLFAVESRPETAKKDFKKLYQLIDDPDKKEEAEAYLNELEEKYGNDDPELVSAGLHLKFLTA